METGIEIFSPEERSEISDSIEAASARDSIKAPGFPSKKQAIKYGTFPILVNAGAIILLLIGLFLLFSFQQNSDYEIRESGSLLGITERALIREIRNEAQLRLNEKDAAINDMHRRINEVSLELGRLELLESVTAEQHSIMEELRRQEQVYSGELRLLEQERIQILTEARIRENEIRNSRFIDQERNAFLDSHLSGFSPDVSIDNIDQSAESALRQQISELNAALMERERIVSELQNNMSDFRDQISSTQQILADRESQLELLRNQNNSLRTQNTSYQQTIASYESMIRRNTEAER